MRTLLLGLDAFDPGIFENLLEQGRIPNLARYVKTGGYSRFAVANPPQSEVSWTSIATGLNPGEHGMFDFVHRDPATYSLNVSLLPTKRGLGGVTFAQPYSAPTIFDQAIQDGYQATALWWPAMFPARRQSPVRTLPGLGTPDILGRLGVGTCFTSSGETANETDKIPIIALQNTGPGRFSGSLNGPLRKKGGRIRNSALEFQIETTSKRTARLIIGKHRIELDTGQWSPIIELSFKVGRFISVRAITRLILTETDPELHLYFLPLQLHPLHSPWPYATPGGFVKKVWAQNGPFLTLGWPQDTTGLEEGCINDNQFLSLCETIFEARERVFMEQIVQFREGLLACVFDTLDRIQHMYLRDRPDIVETWYVKLDSLVGRVEQTLNNNDKRGESRIVIVSDHGFASFDYKVHLNRWLIEQGYLSVRRSNGEPTGLKDVNWGKSQAYAIGLNSIYLNLTGREGQGIVEAAEREVLQRGISDELLQQQGPDKRPVVQSTWKQQEAFNGPFSDHGPDIVVGFSPGYRASSETGLGGWKISSLELNRDHWGADHCIDPGAVPGVLFTNHPIIDFSAPSYRDIPALTIGKLPDSGGTTSLPPYGSDEDDEVIEERLRSLGYL